VKDQLSYPYNTKGKATVLYILISFVFTEEMGRKDSEQTDNKHSLNLICPNFFLNTVLICSAYWWQNTTTHLVFSAFVSKPISLLPSNRAYMLFCMVFVFLPNILTLSA